MSWEEQTASLFSEWEEGRIWTGFGDTRWGSEHHLWGRGTILAGEGPSQGVGPESQDRTGKVGQVKEGR